MSYMFLRNQSLTDGYNKLYYAFSRSSQFSCSVSTFRANSSHTRSTPKESESFYAGLKVNILVLWLTSRLHRDKKRAIFFIHRQSKPCRAETCPAGLTKGSFFPPLALQFSPDSLHVAENRQEHEVTIHSTVPVPCYISDHGHQCGVPLALSVHEPGQTYGKAEDIACVIIFTELRG